MIAGQNEIFVALGGVEEPRVLSDGVRGTLKPSLVRRRLLSGQNFDEARLRVRANVCVVSLRQVSVQRCRVKLRQAVNLVDVAVDAVGHRDINQTVVRTQRNGRLRSFLRQRVQTRTRAAT